MTDTYYIDGYNVIHHSASLQPLAMENFEAARDALIERVGQFCAATGKRATIVFDGRQKHPGPKTFHWTAPGLTVRYSPPDQSADTMIERLVYSSPDRMSIIVVSGDRGIRDLCQAMGAFVMGPDNFLATVREAVAAVSAALHHIARTQNRARLEDRLDERQQRRLRALKKTLEE